MRKSTRIFVYEYSCAGEPTDAVATALHAEGWAMLTALLDDFGRTPGVETCTLLSEQCRRPDLANDCLRCRGPEEELAFRRLAADADFTLVIAPETAGLLEQRCQWVVESAGRLLGPGLAAVGLTSDKLALSQHLRQHGVPTPESWPYRAGIEIPHARFPVICKPRTGAGAQATFLVRTPTELPAWLSQAHAEGWQGEAIIQPFLPGRPVSVAFLLGPSGPLPLLLADQHLSMDGRLRYLGGALPLPADLAERALRLARPALESIPDLRGYVGVDLVLGPPADGSGDALIEINARPTTSYVGLHVLAETNLADMLLRVVQGQPLPPLVWRSGMVDFTAGGIVQYRS